MHSVQVSALHQLRQEGPVQLVDVRSPLEFERGHIPGATNVPLERLTRHALDAFDLGRPIHVVCKSGARSQMAIQRLRAEGLDQLVNVLGGTDGWLALGLPVEQGSGAR